MSPFLVFEDAQEQVEEFTYGEFDRLVNRASNGQLSLGVKKADNLNVHPPNSPKLRASLIRPDGGRIKQPSPVI